MFFCSNCKIKLLKNETGYICEKCQFVLLEKEGIFVDLRVEKEKDKQFYDHIYETDHGKRWYQGLNRSRILKRFLEYLSINYRRERFFRRHLKGKNNLILDLACGAGRDFFTNYGQVIGVDVAFEPLLQAKDRYSSVLQAGVQNLPFADSTFDYVVSSDFFGHVSCEDKDSIMQEIKRILKPNGKTIHIIETDSLNVWFRIAHAYPDLFKKYFIEQIGGHIGLELPSVCLDRWEKNGLTPIVAKKIWGLIWPVQGYTDQFDNEYIEKSRLVAVVVKIARILSRFKVAQVVTNILLNPINLFVESFFNINNGQGLMIVCQKKK